jgi:hypothetical protein
MNRSRLSLLAAAVVFVSPSLVLADDAAYCAQLAALANRYLVEGTTLGAGSVDLTTRSAILDCSKGNTAAGIPVLERKLRASGFTLPQRQ